MFGICAVYFIIRDPIFEEEHMISIASHIADIATLKK